MSAYVNLKTFIASAQKPYIWALKQYYDFQVKYMKKRVDRQDVSLLALQEEVTKLSSLVIDYQTSLMDYAEQVNELRSNLYTSSEVKALDRRCQELEQICLELYTLVKNKLPDADLSDFDDTILTTDKLPTAATLTVKWKTVHDLEEDAELSLSDQQLVNTYIKNYYEDWPNTKPILPADASQVSYTDEQLEVFFRQNNLISATTELTEDQKVELQVYLDFYKYTCTNFVS